MLVLLDIHLVEHSQILVKDHTMAILLAVRLRHVASWARVRLLWFQLQIHFLQLPQVLQMLKMTLSKLLHLLQLSRFGKVVDRLHNLVLSKSDVALVQLVMVSQRQSVFGAVGGKHGKRVHRIESKLRIFLPMFVNFVYINWRGFLLQIYQVVIAVCALIN